MGEGDAAEGKKREFAAVQKNHWARRSEDRRPSVNCAQVEAGIMQALEEAEQR